MYFSDRADAGRQLAAQIVPKYQGQKCVVVALSDGSVLPGIEIANGLECALTMLVSENINLPGETSAIGAVNQDGGFSYNSALSQGQVDEYDAEYHGHIEQQKMQAFHRVNQLLGNSGVISRDLLRNRIVILVSDGLKDSVSLDVAEAYLKPIAIERLVVATPIASVKAIDRMHLLADEMYCLSANENYLDTDHYYEDNAMPTHEKIVSTIQNVVHEWS